MHSKTTLYTWNLVTVEVKPSHHTQKRVDCEVIDVSYPDLGNHSLWYVDFTTVKK